MASASKRGPPLEAGQHPIPPKEVEGEGGREGGGRGHVKVGWQCKRREVKRGGELLSSRQCRLRKEKRVPVCKEEEEEKEEEEDEEGEENEEGE
jgi:hypothetical protein